MVRCLSRVRSDEWLCRYCAENQLRKLSATSGVSSMTASATLASLFAAATAPRAHTVNSESQGRAAAAATSKGSSAIAAK
ncbi:hypothetical protein ATSB10_09910 [Dyella thiooxydans]|uniref:Uncharacterized protein n=1 Tax=Dyella thiooxydans TaxID=445710 RepID=A0A161J285_9GAMM|nr:hypothetical protein ATSB10_09910 [Dyella thiooxydans]